MKRFARAISSNYVQLLKIGDCAAGEKYAYPDCYRHDCMKQGSGRQSAVSATRPTTKEVVLQVSIASRARVLFSSVDIVPAICPP